MSESEHVLMTVECLSDSPTIKDAAKALGVPVSTIDPAFWVIVVDSQRHLFAVQVESTAVTGGEGAKSYRGPFSNPRIETFRPKDKTNPKD